MLFQNVLSCTDIELIFFTSGKEKALISPKRDSTFYSALRTATSALRIAASLAKQLWSRKKITQRLHIDKISVNLYIQKITCVC